MAELRRFSHSLIETMLDCARKAEFRYVKETPAPKSAALVKGSACDRAWNLSLQQKMETGELLAVEDLLDVTEQEFRDDVRNEGGVASIDWGESNARAELDAALRLTKVWHTILAPDIEPTAIQVELHRTLPSGRDFIGFLDFEGVVDGMPAVGDNKTASRKMSEAEAERGLQPSAYGWLKDEPISFVFARAIDTGKSQNAEFVWTARSAGDNAWYDQLVLDVERGFEAGNFAPNPRSNLCGAKYCPFFSRCMPHRVVSGNGVDL